MATENYQTVESINIPNIAIGRLIFNSNLSDVFEARSEFSDLPLAVKVAKPDLISKIALQTEAYLTPSVESNHILPVLSSGFIRQPGTHWNGLLYTVSPLVTGSTLREFKATDRDSIKTALSITQDAARGVRDIHNYGYIHRDVTPGNIFIDDTGNGFIGDLGLAIRKDVDQSLLDKAQVPGRLLGTLGYMSPELMTGDKATEKSDVFGLAVVAIRAMTNLLPWKEINTSDGKVNLTLAEVYQVIVNKSPDLKLPRYISIDCREILYESLSPYPSERPSVEEFIEMPSHRFSFIRNIGNRAITNQTRQLYYAQQSPAI